MLSWTRSDLKHHFSDIVHQVLAGADSHTVKRVVIDLRWNGGGNEHVIDPLRSGLEARLKSVGPVYVLIGPGTFSSAVDNAVTLRKDLSATLVGEPSGGMPGGYGEVDRLTLPNSKLVVRFTTKRWGAKGSSGPSTLAPDLHVPFKLADFIASRDPALDAAIAVR
jgi:C-terminal processing protease CtpA/Prc